MQRRRRRRDRYLQVFRIQDFQEAREEVNRLERDMRNMRDVFGISNENFNDPDHIETIEECVAREEAEDQRRAEEEERLAAQAPAAQAAPTFREKLRNKAVAQSAQLRESLNTLNTSRIQEEARHRRTQLADRFTEARASIPHFRTRIRAMIQREQ